ncbi:MAG: type III PLP-dependent enzyme [Desulfobacterales bacterium]|jgi:ornithine decarboxylase|nr:type III PLP-dependent enzyme [Desulfobacterales bacterium]
MMPSIVKDELSWHDQLIVEAETCRRVSESHGTPLLVLDCETLRRKFRALSDVLPGVQLYYAIKALPHASVVATLHQEGAFFDVASFGEIRLLQSLHLDPRRTVFTHPIKRDADIRKALRFGCTTFVVDNPLELEKFQVYRHRVGILLRVSFRGKDAVVDLSKKFGCAPAEALHLINQARNMGIHIKGLCFHVGSQSRTPDAHVAAIESCKELIARAEAMGVTMSVLNIGGGFPAAYEADTADIGEFCAPIRAALGTLPEHLRVIAEPGRYLAAPSVTAVTSVVGKAYREGRWWYYLDDGVYGSFSGRIFDKAQYPITVLRKENAQYPSVLAGPTCDSVDVIAEDILLPELELGDLVVAHMMGAYTIASATTFNSLEKVDIVILNEKKNDAGNIAYIG